MERVKGERKEAGEWTARSYVLAWLARSHIALWGILGLSHLLLWSPLEIRSYALVEGISLLSSVSLWLFRKVCWCFTRSGDSVFWIDLVTRSQTAEWMTWQARIPRDWNNKKRPSLSDPRSMGNACCHNHLSDSSVIQLGHHPRMDLRWTIDQRRPGEREEPHSHRWMNDAIARQPLQLDGIAHSPGHEEASLGTT